MKLTECYLSSIFNAVRSVYSPVDSNIGVIYMIINYDNYEYVENIFKENHCTIQNIFWISKFDYEICCKEEPKIVDAYDCFIQVRGLKHNLEFSKYLLERKN